MHLAQELLTNLQCSGDSRSFAKERRLEDEECSGQPSGVYSDGLKVSLKLILLQLHKKLPKNSRSTILQSFDIWCKLERWTSFLGCVSSRRSCRSSQNCSTSASSALLVGAETWITVTLNGLPWKWTEIVVSLHRLHPSTAFWTFFFFLWRLLHFF